MRGLGGPRVKPVNSLLSATGTTIFTVMSALANQHGAINLGQGFPDTEAPRMCCARPPTRWRTGATNIRR